MWEMSDSEYSSDEDEDYIPDEESDDEEDMGTLESGTNTLKGEKKSSNTKKVTTKRKRKRGIKLSEDEEEEEEKEEPEKQSASSAESSDEEANAQLESNKEQRILADKAKEEALWAAFKSDVHTSNQQPLSVSKGQKGDEFPANKSEQTTITKTFDFAGEEVRITKTVAADSSEAKKEQQNHRSAKVNRLAVSAAGATVNRLKRSAGGGLGSVLGQIGKKAKISTLEKSRLDWENFKSNQGIAEDLKRHNKDGFLEKQDFLQRTDERQFEAERRMREATRKR